MMPVATPKFCGHCYARGAGTQYPVYHRAESPDGACTDPLSIRGECDCGKANDGHQYLPVSEAAQDYADDAALEEWRLDGRGSKWLQDQLERREGAALSKEA